MRRNCCIRCGRGFLQAVAPLCWGYFPAGACPACLNYYLLLEDEDKKNAAADAALDSRVRAFNVIQHFLSGK